MKRRNTQGGQAMITAVLLFMALGMITVGSTATIVVRDASLANNISKARDSFALAEAVHEDAVYRLKNAMDIDSTETLTIGGATATATVTNVLGGKQVVSEASKNSFRKRVTTTLAEGSGVSFFYGVQVGQGGFTLNNTSSVLGNLYANGPVIGTNSNYIYGDVISAGDTGSVTGVHATGSIYAKTVTDSIADNAIYYQSISSSQAHGSSCPNAYCYPDSALQPTTTFAITDEQIETWKDDAEAGGSVTCSGGSYNISSGNVTLGPKKIPCDLNISNSTNLYLTGPLWVSGTVQFSNNADIYVDASITGKTVPIIADKESNRTTSSKINVSNNTVFHGNGTNSYVLLVSQNNSSELGGGESAMTVSNSITGNVLLYAAHGLIDLSNSIQIKEVTAHHIRMSNSAQVVYESGLANLTFTAGPSGGYQISSWGETQ